MIVGCGGYAGYHARRLSEHPESLLVACVDVSPSVVQAFLGKHVPNLSPAPAIETDLAAALARHRVEAVVIATPHFDHTTLGSAALAAGLHVLVEKPLSVHKADCDRLIAAYHARPKKEQVFGAMFNQRTDPHYAKVRDLIVNGELGEIRRVNWIVTDWFRTEAYYASGGWRATCRSSTCWSTTRASIWRAATMPTARPAAGR